MDGGARQNAFSELVYFLLNAFVLTGDGCIYLSEKQRPP